MKNTLIYYYNLNPENIYLVGNNYEFKINDNYFILYFCEEVENIDKIYELNQEMIKKNIYCHKIIFNNNKKIITNINGKNYILFQTYDEMKKKITLEYIINFNELTRHIGIDKVMWADLWKNKIDYFEYQISEIGVKYPIIRESISYYFGMAELAIALLNEVDSTELCLCHRRINDESTTFDLYNPINIVIDTRVRDSCEYFKNLFKKQNENVIQKIKEYIVRSNLTTNEIKLFFIRLLYPTFYFDMYEKIRNGIEEESNIKKVILLNEKYEELISQVYIFFKKYIDMPEINWIKKI